MDIQRGFIRALVENGYEAFAKEQFSLDVLDDSTKKVLEAVEEYYHTHKCTPSLGLVENIADTSFKDVPQGELSFWIDLLVKRYAYNRLKSLNNKIGRMLESDAHDNIFGCLAQIADELTNTQNVRSSEGVKNMFDPEMVDEVFSASDDYLCMTPWPSLNNSIGGLFPQDLTILSGRPGTGKTWLMLFMMVLAAKDNVPTLCVTTEMRYKAMYKRFWSIFFGLNYIDVKENRFADYVLDFIKQQMKEYEGSVNLLGRSDKSFQLKVEDIAKQVIVHKPKLLVIDGAYLLKSDKIKFNEKHNQVGEIFNLLKAMALSLDVSIVCTTQINRPSSDSKVGLHRLAFSDNLGMVADNVLMIDVEGDTGDERRFIAPLKLREGSPVDKIFFNWDFENMDFGEIDAKSDGD